MSAPYGARDGYDYPPASSTAHLAGNGEKNMAAQRSSFSPTVAGKKKRSPWLWIIGAAVLIIVILGAVLGGVLGSRAANNNSDNKNNNAQSESGSSSKDSEGGDSSEPKGKTFTVTDLPAWNWGQNKSIGMCLGSWLILEKWMLPDWFNETVNAVTPNSGETALDEWAFCNVLGQDKAKEALNDHFNNFVTEDDIQLLWENGINHLRIPVGFWAFIPTIEGEPYVNDTALYQGQIERILGYAHERGMYAIIDMHGLPGSQNGEQSSGQLTENPSWFGASADSLTPNQQRSDEMVKAVTEWLADTPYRSVVTGIEVINEPRPYTEDQNQQLMKYYERSYETIQSSSWPVATFLHNGYTNMTYYYDFAAAHATDPPSMVMVDHPYPGNFPPQNSSSDILSQVCSAAQRYVQYPIPICIDEWGVYTGVKDQAFEEEFYKQQLVTWAWSAGGMYWSYKLITSQQDLANGLDYSQYSWSTLLSNNSATIPKPSDYSINSTTTGDGAQAFLQALTAELTSSCGDTPADVAPYANGSFPVATWSAEVGARSSAAGDKLTATSTTISTDAPTATVRVKRAMPMRG
ncbi:hypothetical protein JCM11641_008113 [Rhodosporidiobolus odoratus]